MLLRSNGRYRALAVGRAVWELPGIEEVLCTTGLSAIVNDRLVPIICPQFYSQPWLESYTANVYNTNNTTDTVDLMRDEIFSVAPALEITAQLEALEAQLDDNQITAARASKLTKQLPIDETESAEDLLNIFAGAASAYGVAAVKRVSTSDDRRIESISDGELHAGSIWDMHQTALSRACQMLGIDAAATTKKEELREAEVDLLSTPTACIREHEINERQRLAERLSVAWEWRA